MKIFKKRSFLKEIDKAQVDESKDKKTEKFNFKERKFLSLSKASKKKPDYVLVQYLRNNRTVDFLLCKVISGNIIVIDNKGYELNPKYTWIRGKNIWYIIREKDTRPVSVIDKPVGHSTDDHPVLIKMVLGAIQKKELSKDIKKIIITVIVLGGIALLGWLVFG